MTTLRATRVDRTDDSSRRARPHTTSVALNPSTSGDALELSFDLAQERRAKSHVVVAIGKADLGRLIQEAVSVWPELGPVLAEKVAGTLAAALEKQQRFQATVAAQTLKQLVQVDHRLDALAEEDLPERAQRQVTSAGNALEAARGTLEAL